MKNLKTSSGMKKLLKMPEKNANQTGECIAGFTIEERRA
jgi:hypothetical protein